MRGEHPEVTILSGKFGQPISAFNADSCVSDDPATRLSCAGIVVSDQCPCTSDSNDCAALDTQCQVGVCNEATGQCEAQPSNEGNPCRDGIVCTISDTCIDGRCRGFGCENPSVCFGRPNACVVPDGSAIVIPIQMGNSDRLITGGQFSIEYDPQEFSFVEIAPGSTCDADSSFELELFESVDEANGTIFYATGVLAGNESFDSDFVAVACLTLIRHSDVGGQVCLLDGLNPFSTILVDEFGKNVVIDNFDDCPASDGPPIIACGNVCVPVPAVSEWALVILALLLLIVAKLHFNRRMVDTARLAKNRL